MGSSLHIGRASATGAVVALALLLAFSRCAMATTPVPDLSFGTGGVAQQPFAGLGGSVTTVFALRDGGILAAGEYVYGRGGRGGVLLSHGALVRYAYDGTPDPRFGSQGIIDPSVLYPRLVQRDGKIVGLSQGGLMRLNADGSPDAGMVTDGATGISWYPDMNPAHLAQQADGRIVVAGTVGAGTAALVLVQFNGDGSLDTAFNYGGAVIVPHGESSNDLSAGLVIQPDGKLVVAVMSDVGGAPKFTLVRYNPDGSPDAMFGTNGRASAAVAAGHQASAAAVVRQPAGRLVVVGVDYHSTMDFNTSLSSLLLVGFTPEGAVDVAPSATRAPLSTRRPAASAACTSTTPGCNRTGNCWSH